MASLSQTTGVNPPVTPPTHPGPQGASCPRCAKPLVDPAGLGWCQSCGYCRSLEEGGVTAMPAAAPAPTKPSAAGEMGKMVGNLPAWFWILVLGMGLFAAVSLLPGYYFAKDPLKRALWCTGQIVAGLLVVLGAQFYAVLVLAPEDDRLSMKDVFLPFRLWGLVLQRLPALRLPLWLAGWGLAVVLSALLFVGGLSHWLTYLPKGNGKPGQSVGRAVR